MKTKPTHPGNVWCDDAFERYIERKLYESSAEYCQENVNTLYTALLTYCMLAGNA